MKTATTCLIIQNEESEFSDRVRRVLPSDRRYSFNLRMWSSFAAETLTACHADIVVAVAFPDVSPAMRLFQWLGAHPMQAPLLAVLSDPVEESLMASALRAATDIVVLPVGDEEIRQRIARMLAPPGSDPVAVGDRLTLELGLTRVIGSDAAFIRVLAQLPRIARSDMPVLIAGETGTGKELCARAIHHLSRRRDHPFIAVDCGSIPDFLFENEMYGHVKGAFTDAQRDQRGLVGMAQGGTLFLDEIDALSPAAQAKLLRLLQERVYRSLGADRFLQADVNVIAATNQDLAARVRDQRFRSDLFYRLNVLSLVLPPLRERRDDILPLARSFLEEVRLSTGSSPLSLSAEAEPILLRYDWPGNVRELQNVVRRAAVACSSGLIQRDDLSIPSPEVPPTSRDRFRSARAAAVEAFERRYVEELLHRHNGNVTHAAREAEKDRRAFGRLIKKYGIQKPHHTIS